MKWNITGLIREYMIVFSIITMIVGFILFLMGIIWYWFKDVELGFYTNLIKELDEGNAYALVIGLIIFVTGIWYIYSFFKNKKFALEELETNKRSEFIKKHSELKIAVRHLPSKYQKMLKEKEKELRIK